jgi:Family of unknown function (DUF6470)
MQVPQIRMSSTFVRLGIQSENVSIGIQQPNAQLEFHSEQPTLTMERTPGRLTIDQTEAWADMGLKSARRSIGEAAQNGYQQWMQYLAASSQNGDELMMVEHGGGAIPSQAKRMSETPMADFNIGFIPSPFSVKIHYQPGDIRMNAQTHKPTTNILPQKPIINHQLGSVSYYIKQPNTLDISI